MATKTKKEEMEYREKVEMVASQVQLLFQFCGSLIEYRDMLKDVMNLADDRASTTMAMAPIIGATGGDWEVMQFEANLKARRSEALYNLIRVLGDTEDERIEFMEKQKGKAEGMAQLRRALGA